MNVNERRKAIIKLLCNRRHETMDNLAFEFSVTRRTIITDITTLSLSYPIYTQSGRHGGGVYIAEDYQLGKRYLSSEEKELLETLTLSVGDDQRKVLESIIQKFGKPRKY